MKDDYGNEWESKDYFYALVLAFIIFLWIAIPAVTFMLAHYLYNPSGWKFVALFLVVCAPSIATFLPKRRLKHRRYEL